MGKPDVANLTDARAVLNLIATECGVDGDIASLSAGRLGEVIVDAHIRLKKDLNKKTKQLNLVTEELQERIMHRGATTGGNSTLDASDVPFPDDSSYDEVDLHTARRALTATRTELRTLARSLETQTAELSAAREAREQSRVLSDELRSTAQRSAEGETRANNALAKSQAYASKVRRDCDVLADELERRTVHLEGHIRRAHVERDAARGELESLRAMVERLKRDVSDAQANSVGRELAEATAATQSAEVQALTAQLAHLRREVSVVEMRREEGVASVQRDAQRWLADAETAARRQEKRLEDAQKAQLEAETIAATAKAEAEKVGVELIMLETRRGELERLCRVHQARIETLEGQVSEQGQIVRSTQHDLEMSNKRGVSLREELQQVKVALSRTKEENNKLMKEQQEQVEAATTSLHNVVDTKANELIAVKRAFNDSQREVRRLVSQIEAQSEELTLVYHRATTAEESSANLEVKLAEALSHADDNIALREEAIAAAVSESSSTLAKRCHELETELDIALGRAEAAEGRAQRVESHMSNSPSLSEISKTGSHLASPTSAAGLRAAMVRSESATPTPYGVSDSATSPITRAIHTVDVGSSPQPLLAAKPHIVAEVSRLQQQIEKLREEAVQVEVTNARNASAQSRGHAEQVAQLTDKLADAHGKIARLRSQLGDATAQIQRHVANEAQVAQLQKEINTRSESAAGEEILQLALAQAADDNAQLRTAAIQTEAELGQWRSSAVLAEENLRTERAKLLHAEAALVACQGLLEATRGEVDAAERGTDLRRGEMQALRDERIALTGRVKELEEESILCRETLSNMEEELEHFKEISRGLALEAERDSKKSSVDVDTVQELRNAVTVANDRIVELEQEIDKFRSTKTSETIGTPKGSDSKSSHKELQFTLSLTREDHIGRRCQVLEQLVQGLTSRLRVESELHPMAWPTGHSSSNSFRTHLRGRADSLVGAMQKTGANHTDEMSGTHSVPSGNDKTSSEHGFV